jgi:hypothetical protein
MMKETDMYGPLKQFLESEGYAVRAEVEGIDVLAKRDEETVIVEMKTVFSLKLVYQCVERLKITPLVYAYVPLEKGGRWPKSYKRMCGLLKRLGCGLLTFDGRGSRPVVCREFVPGIFKGRANYQKRKSALREFAGRSADLNRAGSTKEKIFTVYKEKAIRVALALCQKGVSPVKDIAEASGVAESVNILNRNYNYWFERVSRGVYQVTPEFDRFWAANREKIARIKK